MLELSVPRVGSRGIHGAINALLAPGFLRTAFPRQAARRRGMAIVRGVALALPLLSILGVLLASADAVFASAFRIDAYEVVVHPLVVLVGAWGMAALLRVTSVAPVPEAPDVAQPRLGRTEWTTILIGIDLLFAWFAAARLVALSEGGHRVIATAGLTYAEYARSGFFQLLAAAAITLAALMSLRALVDPADASGRRRFIVLAEIAIGLTLVVVASAFQRLALYERAFGLTMLRLLALSFCVWLAAGLLALGVWIATGARRDWYLAVAGAVALVTLLALNVFNAEAFVVRRNVDHAERTSRFDPAYLSELGDDAVPALVASLPRLPKKDSEALLARLCDGDVEQPTSGWAYNGSHNAAVAARARACPQARP